MSARPDESLATIGEVRRRIVAGRARVEAEVAGRPLWYESSDAALDDGPEAPASATLLAAALGGQGLRIAGPVSRAWLDNVGHLLAVAAEWWDLADGTPEAPVLEAPRPSAPGVALCFTGGVDSFHTLLCAPSPPDVLAFVQGYDIGLTDQARMAAWEPDLRRVAAGTGTRAVVLRSNLRDHAIHAGRHWPIVHGGALAAVGHLLADEVGTLLISSGAPASYRVTWGSHPQLDPLWSSDRVRVVHEGASHSRLAKVAGIVDEPLAQRHLRVCWENRSPTGNCSRCDKCLLTMVLVAVVGAADRFTVFDWSGSLAGHLDEVPRTRFLRTYEEVLATGVDRRLARAIRSLLRRSQPDGDQRPHGRRFARHRTR